MNISIMELFVICYTLGMSTMFFLIFGELITMNHPKSNFGKLWRKYVIGEIKNENEEK